MQRLKAQKIDRLPTHFDELVRLYPPCAIHDDVAYRNAQEMIDALTSVQKLSRDQMRYLDTLTVLFEAYEDEQIDLPADATNPVAVLKHLLEQHEMSASDLGRLLGERSLGTKLLSGDRELSKAHIRTLASHFGVSPALFL